jgi:hypothetical protein
VRKFFSIAMLVLLAATLIALSNLSPPTQGQTVVKVIAIDPATPLHLYGVVLGASHVTPAEEQKPYIYTPAVWISRSPALGSPPTRQAALLSKSASTPKHMVRAGTLRA